MKTVSSPERYDRLDAALAPGARGLAVLPLWWVQDGHCACPAGARCKHKHAKHPLGKLAAHGVKDATKDLERIKKWWAAFPKANVGVACGRESGIVVLDVDPRNGGDKSLAQLEQKHGKLVDTYRVKTGGGGDHHYFKYSDELLNTLKKLTKKLPGLDVQADGRYVVGPGSDHVSGARYEVESHSIAAFEREAFRPPKSKPTEEEKSVPDGLRERALRVLEEQCRVLAATEEGNRDNQENGSGYTVGRHIGANALSYEDAFNKLFAAAHLMKKPRSESEIRQKLEHGLRDGMKNPIADLSVPNYVVHAGRICHMKKNKDGPAFPVPLCNFTAAIVEEVVQDDGSGETTRVYVIEGSLPSGKRLPGVRVLAARFGSMNWPEELWGHDAVVEAGYTTKDMLRVAIHALSTDVRQRHVYTHTGWEKIKDHSVYLTGNGAIGEGGPVDDIEVDLGPELAGYQLPRKIENPAEAMRTSLQLLNPQLAPLTVTVPLWAAQFRAPLIAALPVDGSLHLAGPTGTFKSTLAALCLSHHGGFDETHLPAGWNSTANALERQAFLLKDAPFVVDDYAPPELKRREFEGKFELLMRGQGNLQGRGRLRPDASMRPTYRPRGIIISTGEGHPPGQSLLARTLLVETRHRQVNLKLLAQVQKTRQRLPHAMAGYIAWLAPRIRTAGKELRDSFEERRRHATVEGDHLRVPSAVAHLWLGVDWALRYAEEIGAVTHVTAEEHRRRCWEALLTLGREQARTVEGERPTRRFLEMVFSLCAQRRAALLHPADDGRELKGPVALIGWQDADSIYLIPNAAFELVARACRDSGEPFPARRKILERDLQQEKLLSHVGNDGRTTVVKKLGGRSQRVLALNRAGVERLLETELPAKGLPRQRDKTPLFDQQEVLQ